MNNVVDKLSDIEQDAVAIMDNAQVRKKELAKEAEHKISIFDQQLEALTTQKINDLKNKMEVDMQAQLSKQKSDAEKAIQQMEESYLANHEAYVKKLFQAMTER
ncbi:MAG: ATPase [Hungatella sp.]